ncbi:MAG: Arsenical pump-driving ATPase TEMP, partial [uncultured Blastococcus sp.]
GRRARTRARRRPGSPRGPGDPAGPGGPADGPRGPGRRPRDPDPGLLRLRWRRQDDDVGRAGAGRCRGRPHRRRPHHRPGAPAGAVTGAGGAGQRAPTGGSTRGRRRTARDDAGHEADVRRHRHRSLDAGAGEGDPGEPLLPGTLLVLRRNAGVHGHGEARPAAGQRPVGPDHRRHPAVPVGAGLPRRPEPDEPLPGRHDDPAADRTGPRRWPGGLQVRQRRLPVLQPDHLQDPGRAAAAGHLSVRRRAGHHVRWLPRAGDGDLRAPAPPGDLVRRGRHPGARRAAGGLLLRRPAVDRGHAAGRARAQPHPPPGDHGAVGDASRGRGGGGRRGGGARRRARCRGASGARRADGARRPRAAPGRPVHQRPPRGRGPHRAGRRRRRARRGRPAGHGRGADRPRRGHADRHAAHPGAARAPRL